MRYVVLDCETTGFNKSRGRDVSDGHRIIEIACVEVIGNVITGKKFHRYVNPSMKIDPAATRVHGITDADVKRELPFSRIVHDFLSFVADDVIVIHNAPFDISFLDKEFRLLDEQDRPIGLKFKVRDTLEMARSLFPYQKNRLDDLCTRFGVKGRDEKHGALIDAIILAKVFLVLDQYVLY